MSGDQLNFSISYTYSTAGGNNGTANGFNTLTTSLANMILGSSSAVSPVFSADGAASALQSAQSVNPAVGAFFNTQWQEVPPGGSVPEAYLHVLFFNDQFVFDNIHSAVYPITASGLNAAATITNSLAVIKDGYAYVYFSNESNTTVYFDNFMLTDVRGPLLEMTDYYPYGLTMAATSGTAMKSPYAQNKYRFNGKELQNQEFSNGGGLENYDYGARFQDPQLGRWFVPDPLSSGTQNWSNYNYANDNPIRYLDRDGRSVILNGQGLITQINLDGDPGVYINNGGPNSQVGFMDPNAVYHIGGRYKYYDKSDYYEKHPVVYYFFVFMKCEDCDPNPDQNNSQEGSDKFIAGTTLTVLFMDMDFGEGTGGVEAFSAKMGKLIGWGEGATEAAVAQTKAVTEGLTAEQVQVWKQVGLTKEWITKQLELYTKAIIKGGDKLKNINLLPRKELMEKILSLWE